MLGRALLCFCIGFSGAALAAPQPSLFKEGDHCVAYKANQKQFFIRNSPVIGKTCEISSQVIPQPGEKYLFEIRVPIHSFRSGDTKRDEDVARILRKDVQAEIIFKSESMEAAKWKELSERRTIPFSGELILGDKSYSVSTVAYKVGEGDKLEFDGVIRTKLSYFEITPPKMVGGVVANVNDEVELHFHIVGSRTLGLDSLL